jgi:hypothetical protein
MGFHKEPAWFGGVVRNRDGYDFELEYAEWHARRAGHPRCLWRMRRPRRPPGGHDGCAGSREPRQLPDMVAMLMADQEKVDVGQTKADFPKRRAQTAHANAAINEKRCLMSSDKERIAAAAASQTRDFQHSPHSTNVALGERIAAASGVHWPPIAGIASAMIAGRPRVSSCRGGQRSVT